MVWPNVQGYCDLPDEKLYCDSTSIAEPIKDWTPCIAPSGIDYYFSNKIPEWKNSILLATLKGVSLKVLKLNNNKNAILSEKTYFEGDFGRIRDICISPDGDIYISTSNRDWNPLGVPKPHDDRIIRIAKISNLDNLTKMKENEKMIHLSGVEKINKDFSSGESLYKNYCASCHKQDGNGVVGSFPALNKNSIVLGNKNLVIPVLLKGAAGITGTKGTYSEKMPAFNFMDDQQMADVLTYIRHKWENHADSVTSSEVKIIRKKLK